MGGQIGEHKETVLFGINSCGRLIPAAEPNRGLVNNVWPMRWGPEDREEDARREHGQEGSRMSFELREGKAGNGEEGKRRFRVRVEGEMGRGAMAVWTWLLEKIVMGLG